MNFHSIREGILFLKIVFRLNDILSQIMRNIIRILMKDIIEPREEILFHKVKESG